MRAEISFADRPQYTTARDGNRNLIIGEPLGGRVTGEPVVIVSRARATLDGSFDGVIAIGISLNRFTEFYRGITSVQENSVTLLRTDGVVLVRQPAITTGASRLSPATAFMRSVRSGAMFHHSAGELDGIERMHTLAQVGTYPVFVSYGLSLKALRGTWLIDLLFFGIFAALTSIGLFLVTLLALRRLRNEQRVVAQWQDEVHRREQAEHALWQTQKMEALGQLTGGVAHDFNNLLMVISGNMELLKRKAGGVGADRQIKAIEHAARNGEALTRKLLAFSRRGLAKATSIDLEAFAAKIIDLLKPSLPQDVEIVAKLSHDIWPVRVDAYDLELSVVNVVLNARDAMPGGGTVTLSAQNRTLRGDDPKTEHLSGDFVALSIGDAGTGIPPENLSRVFEPFFTTKQVGRGTGLGLSQVYGFTKQNSEAVTIDSTVGRGTTVTLYLPRAEAMPEQAAERAPGAAKTSGAVLLVEDNLDVAEAATAMLQSLGCTVEHAIAAEPALKLIESGAKFDMVLSDIVMPGGLDGVELARLLRQRYPSLPVLLTTGYSNAAQKAAGDKFPILLKPYQTEELQRAIGEAMGTAAARPA
jgi:two-component system NtrC family sensor kinase